MEDNIIRYIGMLYRHKDGTYTASSFDGEHARKLKKKEGIRLLKNSGMPKKLLKQILKEGRQGLEGFVIT